MAVEAGDLAVEGGGGGGGGEGGGGVWWGWCRGVEWV